MAHIPLLFESFILNGTFRNHNVTANEKTEDAGHDCASLSRFPAIAILDALQHPWEKSYAKEADRLPFLKQTIMAAATADISAQEVCRTVPEAYLSLYAEKRAPIEIGDYILHLIMNMGQLKVGAEVYVMALVLLHRVAAAIPVCGLSVHRMFLAAAVICAKSRTDKRIGMSFYAEAGGVAKNDLIEMEAAMMAALGFDIGVSTAEYVDMVYSLRQHCSYLAYVRRQEWAAAAWAELVECLQIPLEETLRRELIAICTGQSEAAKSPEISFAKTSSVENNNNENEGEFIDKSVISSLVQSPFGLSKVSSLVSNNL